MAKKKSINNNLNNIIGEIHMNILDTPTNIYSEDDHTLLRTIDGDYCFYNELTKTRHFHYYKDEQLVKHPNSWYIYKKIIRCGLTKKIISYSDMFPIEVYNIISQYEITHENIRKGNPIRIINMGNFGPVHFVFNIIDIRKALFAFIICNNKRRFLEQPCMESETIEHILKPFIDYPYIDEHVNFKSEYNFKFPKFVSKYQIKKLYRLDMIKMVLLVSQFNLSETTKYMVLSDESFDNNIILQNRFVSKTKMHEFINTYMLTHSIT